MYKKIKISKGIGKLNSLGPKHDPNKCCKTSTLVSCKRKVS